MTDASPAPDPQITTVAVIGFGTMGSGIAKREVARLVAAGVPANDPTHYPTLRRGSEGDAVEILQVRLRLRGFPLTLDGDFGAATELAVKTFQSQAGLVADGVVGPKSWAVLIPKSES